MQIWYVIVKLANYDVEGKYIGELRRIKGVRYFF